ncbi:MAG TPA: hypothetical protein VLH60_03840, partial [Sedimentisphaerales bacterium]|nr:hypothetical protein [Sedimentisphaerales bacterium]
MQEQRRDIFAEIAAERQQFVNAGLVVPQPPVLPRRFLSRRSDMRAAFKPRTRLDTPEKLRKELERFRKTHQKFLTDLAPEIESARISTAICDFDWRVQTPADQRDFSLVL